MTAVLLLLLLLPVVSDDWVLGVSVGLVGLVGVAVVVVMVEEGREGLCCCHAGGTILLPLVRPGGG